MKIEETKLKGCFIIQPIIFEDARGSFCETFNAKKFEAATGYRGNFVQDNQSKSSYGVLRGLHFQQGEFAQAKLVRVVKGKVLDVAVDLRQGSPTFGEHVAIELSVENSLQLYLPRGFGHGFSVLSETAIFAYKCDNYYNKQSESGIIYSDPNLNINWGLPSEDILLSEKDLSLPTLKEFQCSH